MEFDLVSGLGMRPSEVREMTLEEAMWYHAMWQERARMEAETYRSAEKEAMRRRR